MNPLSDRINNLSTSQTLAMAALARELKAQGKDIISLSLENLILTLLTSLKKLLRKQLTKTIVLTHLLKVMVNLKKQFVKNLKETMI